MSDSDSDSSSSSEEETNLLSHISEADEFTSEIDQTSQDGEHVGRGRLFSEAEVTEETKDGEAAATNHVEECGEKVPDVGAAPKEDLKVEESLHQETSDLGDGEEELKPELLGQGSVDTQEDRTLLKPADTLSLQEISDLRGGEEEIRPEAQGQDRLAAQEVKELDKYSHEPEGTPLLETVEHEKSHYELFTSGSESMGILVDAVKLRKCDPNQGLPLLPLKAIEALEALKELNKGTCLIYGNGVYEGGLKDRRPHGMGAASWPGGESYHGEWLNGVPGGHGEFSIKTRSTFSGDWEEGHRSGYGVLTEESKFTYRGGFESGLFSRFGCLSMTESGFTYFGWFREGKRHGLGTITKAGVPQEKVQRFRNDELDQEFDQGSMAGEIQTLHLGAHQIYCGHIRDGGVPHGLGAEFGEVVAEHASAQVEASGMKPPKRAVYLGGFRNGDKDGWGVDCPVDGERFVGWRSSGERSGMGLAESNDQQYRGEWDHGVRHGFGVCIHALKNMAYVGFWRRGAMHGRGLWMVVEPSNLDVVVFASKNGAQLRGNSEAGRVQKDEIKQILQEYDSRLRDALAQVKATVTDTRAVMQEGRLPSQTMLDTANEAASWAENLQFWPFPEPQKPPSLRTKITSFFKPK